LSNKCQRSYHKYSMDTFCSRSWNDYRINLDQGWQMCCKTPWRSIDEEGDWFNGSEIKERRSAHLEGRRHDDCATCWKLEDRGQISHRQLEQKIDPRPTGLDSIYPGHLDIELSNICDLACRYCSARASSVWAERWKNPKYDKASRGTAEQRQEKFERFMTWLTARLDKFTGISFSGGEALLNDELYELLERLDLQDMKIKICTNLNTPPAYMARLHRVLDKLIANRVEVTFRISMDGTGERNDWQRSGSNWSVMERNWYELGARDVRMNVAMTTTPLTLEGMCDAGRWVRDNAQGLFHKPTWERPGVVLGPAALDPMPWISSYRDELREMLELVSDTKVTVERPVLLAFDNWLTLDTGMPSREVTQHMVSWLDEHQKRWGGADWRGLYTKLSGLTYHILSA